MLTSLNFLSYVAGVIFNLTPCYVMAMRKKKLKNTTSAIQVKPKGCELQSQDVKINIHCKMKHHFNNQPSQKYIAKEKEKKVTYTVNYFKIKLIRKITIVS